MLEDANPARPAAIMQPMFPLYISKHHIIGRYITTKFTRTTATLDEKV